MSSVTVKIPTPLRPLTAGQAEVKIEGATVGEVLLKMDSQFKGFSDRIMDNGKTVKRFINVFVNEDNIRDKKELETEVRNGDTISILPSIAGGYVSDPLPLRGSPPQEGENKKSVPLLRGTAGVQRRQGLSHEMRLKNLFEVSDQPLEIALRDV